MARMRIIGRQELQETRATDATPSNPNGGTQTVMRSYLYVIPVDSAGKPLNTGAGTGMAGGMAGGGGGGGYLTIPVESLAAVEHLTTDMVVELTPVTA
jgi:hypothetical protein